MKKSILTLTSLALLALLSCWLVIHVSCKHEDDCSGCYLSNTELAFICYSGGEKVIFKNDTTHILDTLYAESKGTGTTHCSSPCDEGAGSITEWFTFTNLDQFDIDIAGHGQTPEVDFADNNYNYIISFLFGTTQTVTVNGTTYNDVYSMQIDSTKISNAYKQTVPWKVYYSKSNGFIRFYMINGQTWSKT